MTSFENNNLASRKFIVNYIFKLILLSFKAYIIHISLFLQNDNLRKIAILNI